MFPTGASGKRPNAVLGSARDGFGRFCVLHVSSCPKYIDGQNGLGIYTATFGISGGTTGRRCCGHICVGEFLH